MQCPNCFISIRASERRNNQCLKCNGTFVFEPKTHPLGLTDTYFLKTAEKLGDNGKYFFTPEQFYFSLNRKQIRQKNSLVTYIFFAAFTFIAAIFNSWKITFVIGLFWTFFFAYRIFLSSKTVSLKQEFHEFNYEVLQPWKNVHKNLPPRLIINKLANESLKETLRGFLLCDTQSTTNFLLANNLGKNLSVYISNDVNFPKTRNPYNLPIFVLHDAGFNGYQFLAEIERLYENEQKVFDLGLRPHDVKELELAKFRRKFSIPATIDSLTNEENKWLTKGFYTPLFVIKPSRLLELVSSKIERIFAEAENT